jgi:integrase
VRYNPKSGKGRTIALSETVIPALHAHRIAQAEQLLQLGIRTAGETHVCTNDDGSPLRPNTLTLYWKRRYKTLGQPVIRFHDLRHPCATHMLVLGSRNSATAMCGSRWISTRTSYQNNAAALVDEQLQVEIARRKTNG